MHLTTVSLLSFALTYLTAAAPAPYPVELVERSCTTITPDVMINWDKSNPDYAPTGASGGYFHLTRTGGANSNTIRTAFSFNHLPAGATGCMLQFQYPAVWKPNLFATGANNFDIFNSTAPIAYGTSWNTQPDKGAFEGSMNVAEWITTTPFKTIVWSTGTCSSGLSFIAELSDWQQDAGNIAMGNDGFGQPIAINSGFSLIYNC